MDIFTVLFYQPLFNLLVVLYHLFGNDLGLAIIGIALLSRIVTLPITLKQIQMAKSSQELNAKIKEVKERYKHDKELQSKEMMKVQSQYLPGQLGGCVSSIVQFILLINIYHVITDLINADFVNKFNTVAYSFIPHFNVGDVVNSNFLNLINLLQSPSQIGYSEITKVLPYLILAVIVGIVQFYSTRIMMGQSAPANPEIKLEKDAAKAKKSKAGKDDKEKPQDFAEIMQQSTRQTMYIFPVLLVFISLTSPAGLGLYWTVQSGFVIIQQYIINLWKKQSQQKLNSSSQS